ncbi:hypothetical protein BKA57DRAFT_441970 [Linnemannia elongata]|uniref:Voltage-gated hydrogen channel 1 n=1 Tax=Linnemannia elongata AG-77 TaxID=1314771 RepID=A0A197K6A2_9FUNG|nr:hypothetical protein BGZ88_011124 [Linnemannia elongata]KAH7038649.1 hypothetical protein BKA57DRAFT_441970 [Linnemannia elongata]KAK5821436.1 hypothetical protein F5H01DRAFT_274743 [Linnemannia elongata]OAQ32698.1 hypothetical protein K457DRAFT_16258 [Linnemannia elongata AG-77]
MSQSSYGAIPTDDQDNNPINASSEEDTSSFRHQIGEILESKKAHALILILTAIDVALVILQIAASLLHYDDTKEAQWFLELLAHTSLAIVSIFVLEIILKVYAFGLGYFWTGNPHGVLHLLDALIIIISFLLEVFLKGAEQELGALLIIFRLWRLVKLTGTVAIETVEHNQATVAALEQRIKVLENELKESQSEVQRLRANTADQV